MSDNSGSGGDAKRKRIGSGDDDNLRENGPPEKGPRRRRDKDCVQINVGGKIFTTSRTNLRMNSTFFASRFSPEWDVDDDEQVDRDDIMFIDQDPVAFAVLLNYFRRGFIESSKLTRDVISQLVYFRVEKLLREIKIVSYRHVHAQYGPKEGSPTATEYDEHYDDDDHIVSRFDDLHGSIEDALKSGFLPKNICAGQRELAAIVIDNSSERTILFDPDPFSSNLRISEASLDVPKYLIESDEMLEYWKQAMDLRSQNHPVFLNIVNGEVAENGRGSFPCTTFLDGLQLFQYCGFTTIERELCRRNPSGPQVKFWFSRIKPNKVGHVDSCIIFESDEQLAAKANIPKQFVCVLPYYKEEDRPYHGEQYEHMQSTDNVVTVSSVGGSCLVSRTERERGREPELRRRASSVFILEHQTMSSREEDQTVNKCVEEMERRGYTCPERFVEEMVQFAFRRNGGMSNNAVSVRSKPLFW